MLKKGKMAVCRLTPRTGLAPRLVSLLPQEEKIDKDGIQVVPNGLHMIYLPFADDIRAVVVDPTEKVSLLFPHLQANEEQINAAKKVVKSLRIRFDARKFNNPGTNTTM